MKDNGIPTDALESGKRKVLLVDDDAELVELMTKVLDEDGRFEVRIANNGFDAGMMVKEYRPDLIVLDVMLPDINGKEVCHRVRADTDPGRRPHPLHLAAWSRRTRSRSCKLAGADDFLHKPFDVEDLIDRMCAQLDLEPAAGVRVRRIATGTYGTHRSRGSPCPMNRSRTAVAPTGPGEPSRSCCPGCCRTPPPFPPWPTAARPSRGH